MKNQDEEVIALENKKIIQENDKVDKVDEVDDEIEEPFKISKKGLNNIMNNYLSRKLDEELSYIQLKGGIKFLEEALQTDFKNGLGDTDNYLSRKSAFDSNEEAPEEPLSFWAFVKEALEDTILRILLAAALVSIVVEMIHGEDRRLDWIEGFAIIVTVFVVTMVGSVNNYEKEKEFRNLKSLNEKDKTITVIRNGSQSNIPVDKVLVGDLMMIIEGMAVVADGILIEGNNISVDESAMTGETDMVEKDIFEECIKQKDKLLEEHPEIQDKVPENYHHKIKSPIISSGTQIASGSGWLIVIAVGPNSQNGKILSMIEANKQNNEGTPLQQKLTSIAEFIGYCGLATAIVTAIGMAINLAVRASQKNAGSAGPEIIKIFLISIIVIVVAIPEGLPLAVTLTLAFSIKKMILDQNLVRRMEACETMGGADYICTDKTGTLTKNEMTIVKIYDGVTENEMNNLYTSNFNGKPTDIFSQDFYDLFKLVSSCNTLTEFSASGEETSTFKTDLAFTKILKIFRENIPELRKRLILYINQKKITIPFSSKRKKMSTIVSSTEFPQGFRMVIKGGSEIVLPACDYYRDGSTIAVITNEKRMEFEKIIKTYAEMTLRTIVIGYKEISQNDIKDWEKKEIRADGKDLREIYEIEESGFIMIGIIGIMDILKEGVDQAVLDCQLARINVIMVTGDNLITACAIAKSCHIMQDHGRTKAMLGDAFLQRCGGVVCQNCFDSDKYLNALKEAKSRYPKPEYYNVAINNCKYKCNCFLTEDEGKVKLRNKLFSNDILNLKQAKTEEEKLKIEENIQKKINEEIEKNPLKIKKDVIANKEKFDKMVRKICVIARSQPSHKYCLVAGLRELDHVVAVTGDGTNDASALSKADVGFAMNNGTDIAKEASDIIIIDNNFTSIVNSVLWGRNVYDNIRRFLQFQLSVNVVACLLVFLGSVIGSESPLSTIQMLWVNMIMDSLGSLALATESPHRGLLDRSPGKKKDYIINRKMMKHIFGQSFYQMIILLILLFAGQNFLTEKNPDLINYGFGLKYCFNAPITIIPSIDSSKISNPVQYISTTNPTVYLISGMVSNFANSTNITNFGNSTYCNMLFPNKTSLTDGYNYFKTQNYATTHFSIIFHTFVIMQIFNQICCRIIDDNYNLFFRIQTNLMFFVISLIELAMQTIIVEFLGIIFKVSKGGVGPYWGICIGFSAITFVMDFLIKLIPDNIFSSQGNTEIAVGGSKILNIKGDSKVKNASIGGVKKESLKKESFGASKRNQNQKESSKKIDNPASFKGNHVQLNAMEGHV